ncbi:hypothetical protein K443DRAFT_62443, partial [Laccaria amethystina LaAM-08-1]
GLQKLSGKTAWRIAQMNPSWINPVVQPQELGHASILLDLLGSGPTPTRLCSIPPSNTTSLSHLLSEVLVNR